MTAYPPRVLLAELTEHTSAAGNRYVTGFLAKAWIVGFWTTARTARATAPASCACSCRSWSSGRRSNRRGRPEPEPRRLPGAGAGRDAPDSDRSGASAEGSAGGAERSDPAVSMRGARAAASGPSGRTTLSRGDRGCNPWRAAPSRPRVAQHSHRREMNLGKTPV